MSLFKISLAGGRDVIVGAPDARTRDSWIMAITATKTHGELVSKAWTALGGDCAAEVVQLMSLANDWEDLILAGVGLDYKPERSTMNMSGKSTRKLMNLVGGNFFMPSPTPASLDLTIYIIFIIFAHSNQAGREPASQAGTACTLTSLRNGGPLAAEIWGPV